MSGKTRTITRKQWQQLHVLTFLGGRESVCKIICAIGDCLDTSGRLEDLPGGLLILVFGELTDNDILKKVRSLESWHGQLCLDNRRSNRVPAWRRSQTRKDQGHSSAQARCWHSVNWPILTLLSVADRGVSGPWGPQFCGALCYGETQRLPAGGAGSPPVGSEAEPRRQTHFGNNIGPIENWLKIRYFGRCLHP